MGIAALAAAKRMTEREFLLDLVSRHTKFETMGTETGLSYVTISRHLKLHRINRMRQYDFVHDGIVGSLKDHCERLGLNYESLMTMKRRKEWTGAQIVDYGLHLKRMREAKNASRTN